MEPSSQTSPEWLNQIPSPRICIVSWGPQIYLWAGNGQKGNSGSKGTCTYPTKRSSAYRLSTTTMTIHWQATSEKQGLPNSSTATSIGWDSNEWCKTTWPPVPHALMQSHQGTNPMGS